MTMNPAISSLRDATAGLWRSNLAPAQLLGLCPLLAVTTSFVNGLALGLLTTVVLVIANPAMSLVRGVLVPAARIPLYLLLVAALVTSLEMVTHAVLYDLHEMLGIYLPLIAVNCGLLAHAETVASRKPLAFVIVSSLATGLGFLFTLMMLGALREALGSGTLLAGTELLRGDAPAASGLELPFDGMLVAVLPPGAFFGMALLLALRNRLLSSAARNSHAPALPEAPR